MFYRNVILQEITDCGIGIIGCSSIRNDIGVGFDEYSCDGYGVAHGRS
jgi:hypothetical protein